MDTIARVWAEVIGRDVVGPDDNFFDVGGTSMTVVRMHQRLGAELGTDGLTLVELFEYPTPRLLAARLTARSTMDDTTAGRPGRDPTARRAASGLGDRRRAARARAGRAVDGEES